jgi:hypothetical protein
MISTYCGDEMGNVKTKREEEKEKPVNSSGLQSKYDRS